VPPRRGYREWAEDRGFKMAKLYPVDWESAIAELYFGDLIWAYVSLEGVDQAATGAARVRNARVVVEFWREPDKPLGVWDFNLDLAGALEQLRQPVVAHQDMTVSSTVGRLRSYRRVV
jgi:hypothetical protein